MSPCCLGILGARFYAFPIKALLTAYSNMFNEFNISMFEHASVEITQF